MTGSERVPQSTSEEEKHRTVDTVLTVEKKQFRLLNYALDKGFWSVRPRRGNSMQKRLPLLDSILIPYHRDHRGLRAMISLSF